MKAIQAFLFFVVTVCFFFLALNAISWADTVELRNGAVIHGRVSQDLRAEGGPLRLDIGERGYILLRPSEVARVERNERHITTSALEGAPEARPVPAALKDAVVVELKGSSDYYGPGPYAGWVESPPGAEELVLRLPGGGVLRVPAAAVERIRPAGDEDIRPAVEPGPRTLSTSHVVHLKNGRVLRGNVEDSGPGAPLKLRLGHLGVLSIPREAIDRIEEAEGTYELPPEPEAAEGGEEPAPVKDLEELKRALRREILRELLERLLEEKIDEKVDAALRAELEEDLSLEGLARRLSGDEILEIQFHVRELGRQRNTNRVRAEAALKRRGAAALPFLSGAARHPFELTRRAVQRVVRDAGDVRGVPLALEGLADRDVFVRGLAHEALVRLLGERIAFDPGGPRQEWLEVQERYRRMWDALRRERLRQALSDKLASF